MIYHYTKLKADVFVRCVETILMDHWRRDIWPVRIKGPDGSDVIYQRPSSWLRLRIRLLFLKKAWNNFRREARL